MIGLFGLIIGFVVGFIIGLCLLDQEEDES
jgi:hypothetical protein